LRLAERELLASEVVIVEMARFSRAIFLCAMNAKKMGDCMEQSLGVSLPPV
jgi:hypothetical protein